MLDYKADDHDCPFPSGPERDKWFVKRGAQIALQNLTQSMETIVRDSVDSGFKASVSIIREASRITPDISLEDLANVIEESM